MKVLAAPVYMVTIYMELFFLLVFVLLAAPYSHTRLLINGCFRTVNGKSGNGFAMMTNFDNSINVLLLLLLLLPD